MPSSLDEEFRKDGSDIDNPYWLDRLEKKLISGEPTVKDVCANCNNVVLSRLDAYACNLYRRYFHKIADIGDQLDFEYEYDHLLRLILKINFNSARANLAADLEQLRKLRWYIIGMKRRPKRAALLLSLTYRHSYPSEVKEKALQKGVHLSEFHEPDMLRFGHFTIQSPQWNPMIARTAFFQSFAFFVLVLEDKEPAITLDKHISLMLSHLSGVKLIPQSTNKIRVTSSLSSKDAIDSHIRKNMDFYKKQYPNLHQ